MIPVPSGVRIWIATGRTDMRKGMQGVALLVQEGLGEQLKAWSVVIFKKFLGAYAIYGGSDFDIDAAVEQAYARMIGIDFARLRSLARLQPILAKRHYHRTGVLW